MFKKNRFKRTRIEGNIDSLNDTKKIRLGNVETENILCQKRIDDITDIKDRNLDRNLLLSSTNPTKTETDDDSMEGSCPLYQLSTYKENEITKLIERQMEKILPCPICGKQLKTYNSRVMHLKKCSSEYNVIAHDLMQLMTKQLEERDFNKKFAERTLRGKLMTALNTAPRTKFRETSKRNKLRYEEPKTKFDEDVQLAIALSTSMDVKQDNSKAFLKKKVKSLQTKTCELIHPLMTISSEDCKMLTQDKFSRMLSEQSGLMCTLTDLKMLNTDLSKSCLIGKYQAKRSLWNVNSKIKSNQLCMNWFLVSESTELRKIILFHDNLEKTLPFQKENNEAPFTQTADLLTELATDFCCTNDDIKEYNFMESQCFKKNVGDMQVPAAMVDYSNPMKCFLLMVDNPVLSDLILILDEGHKFHVHKFILLVKCPKLFEMISDKREYPLPSFTLQTVQSFFEFIYASVVTFDHSIVQNIFQLAQRFEIIGLMNICKSHMITISHLINKESEDEYDRGQHNFLGNDNLNIIGEDSFDDMGLDEVYEYMITQRRLKQESDNDSDAVHSKECYISTENEGKCSKLKSERSKKIDKINLKNVGSSKDVTQEIESLVNQNSRIRICEKYVVSPTLTIPFLNEMKPSTKLNFDDFNTEEFNSMINVHFPFEINGSSSTPIIIQEKHRQSSSSMDGQNCKHLTSNEVREQCQDIVARNVDTFFCNEESKYNDFSDENMNKLECKIYHEKIEHACQNANHLSEPNNISESNHKYADDMEDVWENFQESLLASPDIKPLIQSVQKISKNSFSLYETPEKITPNIIIYSPPTDISHLESSPDTASKTPIIKNTEIKVDSTPILKYENMDTPLLKQHCHKFGVRILPKTKMVKVLKNIYYGTHPSVPRTPTGASRKATRAKKTANQKDVISKQSQFLRFDSNKTSLNTTMKKDITNAPEDTKEMTVFTFKNKNPAKHVSPNEKFLPTIFPISLSIDANKETNSTNMKLSQDANMFISTNIEEIHDTYEDFDEIKCFEEYFEDVIDGNKDEVDDNPTQKSVKCIKLTENHGKEKLFEFFQTKERLLQILHYEPFELNDLVACIKSNNIKISKQLLVEFLDEKNILFTTRSINRNSHHNPTKKIPLEKKTVYRQS